MATKQDLQAEEAPVNRKSGPDPTALLASINTGLVILIFGAAWFGFLQGLTTLGRILKVWHF